MVILGKILFVGLAILAIKGYNKGTTGFYPCLMVIALLGAGGFYCLDQGYLTIANNLFIIGLVALFIFSIFVSPILGTNFASKLLKREKIVNLNNVGHLRSKFMALISNGKAYQVGDYIIEHEYCELAINQAAKIMSQKGAATTKQFRNHCSNNQILRPISNLPTYVADYFLNNLVKINNLEKITLNKQEILYKSNNASINTEMTTRTFSASELGL